ncbi:MAG TPA: hypothetical protein VJS43_12660 [Candidatus Acidoferrales bacterium]|nr:hypothetical protein [Candidatus Acidoferrales bacterium]
MSDLLDGAEKELSSADRMNYAEAFAGFRVRLAPGKKIRNRTKLEREVESFLNGDNVIREAASTHLGKRTVVALSRAEGLLRRTEKVLKLAEAQNRARVEVKRKNRAKRYIN